MKNRLTFIKNVIRSLKRNYGMPITFYKYITATENIETGVVDTVLKIIPVRRAIILQSRWQADFVYDLSYIAANNNMTYGGLFDRTQRRIIIDALDLPDGVLPISNSDFCVIEDRWYVVKESFEFEHRHAFLFLIKAIGGQEIPTKITKQFDVTDKIELRDTCNE